MKLNIDPVWAVLFVFITFIIVKEWLSIIS